MKKIQFTLLNIVLLSSIYSLSLPNLRKEQQWQHMEQKVDTWTNVKGSPIGSEIKKTMVVLNLLEFTTADFCCEGGEGNWDYPWINFKITDPFVRYLEARENKISQIIEKIEPSEDIDTKKLLDKLYDKLHAIRDVIAKIELQKLIPLQNLINTFYKERTINPDRMLILKNGVHLQSLGADWQVTRNENEQLEKLHEYQEEMKLFTNFLIEYWEALIV